MVDELYDRGYRAARSNLNAHAYSALATVAQEISRSLQVLHRIQWSAPWAAKSHDPGHA